MFPSEATRHWTRRGPKSGLMSQYHKHLASAQIYLSSGRQSQLERCYWQLLLSKLPRTLAVPHIDREFCTPSKGTSPTAWQHRYSYAVRSATSSDSHKATSDVVQLLGHVENCFNLRLLWRHCINGTSSGQVCTRQPGNNCTYAGGRCRWMLCELANGYRVCFWHWLAAKLVQIVAKLMVLQTVIFIFLISLQCKYGDNKANGNLRNHRKHTIWLYLNFSRQVSGKVSNTKFHEIPSNGSTLSRPERPTEKPDEADTRFTRLCQGYQEGTLK